MKISIVIPAYNAQAFLSRTIDSVRAQTWTDWELVILDDGSTDATYSEAQRYATVDRRIRVIKTPNGGVANARNAGYRETNTLSEFVIFLDHDDVWVPHALERLAVALEDAPHAAAAHALAQTTDITGTPAGQIYSWDRRKVGNNKIEVCSRTEPTTFDVLVCDCVISTPGIALIRRSAFEKIDRGDNVYFDQSVASGDDWDMWLRLSLHGDIVFVDEVLLDWRQHAANGSKDQARTFAAEARVRRKMSTWPELTADQRRKAQWRCRRVYASIERRNARACRRWMRESVKHGRIGKALRFAGAWAKTYGHYISLRMFGDRGYAIPICLVDEAQVILPSLQGGGGGR